MKKYISLLVAILPLCLPQVTAAAPSGSPYYSKATVNYATRHVKTPYGKKKGQNWFPDFGTVLQPEGGEFGGNCTNFGSQSIAAGLSANTGATPAEVYVLAVPNYRRTGDWFFRCDKENVGSDPKNNCRSYSWASAHDLFRLSGTGDKQSNFSTKFGLTMEVRTKTSAVNGTLTPLDPTKINLGDIIFADWGWSSKNKTNVVDHTMVVTGKGVVPTKGSTEEKYNSITVSYQGARNYGNTRKLGDIWKESKTLSNWWNGKDYAFYAYRPVMYVVKR